MTTINIVGWYGTETIGDRAILAGLVHIFSKVFDEYEIQLGSLFPDFTERTVLEDDEFLRHISCGKLSKITLYDSTIKSEINKSVKKSDYLFLGGGPFMDVPATKCLEYAFRYAKKKNVKTGVLGCGYGPIRQDKYISLVKSILSLSDIIIFRDNISKEEYQKVSGNKVCYSSIDPAVFCAHYAKGLFENLDSPKKDEVAINFRDVELDSYQKDRALEYRNYFMTLLDLETQKDKIIHLVPMHTFYIGGDDRVYLYNLSKNMKTDKIIVQSKPLSLYETMKIYYDAEYCYGMRFHSVLLQTILNGNNIILDYTDPTKGKIIGLLKQLNVEEQYVNSYVSLPLGQYEKVTPSNHTIVPDNLIEGFKDIYIKELQNIL